MDRATRQKVDLLPLVVATIIFLWVGCITGLATFAVLHWGFGICHENAMIGTVCVGIFGGLFSDMLFFRG